MDIADLLIYASIFSPVAGIFIGFHQGLLKDKVLRFIVILLIISFLSDIIMLTLAKNGIRNLPVVNTYGILEGVLLFLFFRSELKKYGVFILTLLSLYIIFYIIDLAFITGILEFNTYSRSLESVFMIMLSILFFYHIYVHETNIFIEKNPDFLIVTGILIYFSGAFFTFILSSDILTQDENRFYGSWIIHNTANIIKNVLITVGLWKATTI